MDNELSLISITADLENLKTTYASAKNHIATSIAELNASIEGDGTTKLQTLTDIYNTSKIIMDDNLATLESNVSTFNFNINRLVRSV